MFDGSRVKVGPGTLYAAPLGTAEPVSLTGAWPSGWAALGYTDQGSTFSIQPTSEDTTVEEEAWPVGSSITAYVGGVEFAMAELTQRNYLVALNGGIGSSQLAAATGTNADGSLWVEQPDIGAEVRLMLGWDALPKGATSGDAYGRFIFRQCLQTGNVQESHRKSPSSGKTILPVSFKLEKPAGKQPFRRLLPASMAA